MGWKVKAESKATACDHCKKPMYRASTFLIENEKGESKQVGRTCLKFYVKSGSVCSRRLSDDLKQATAGRTRLVDEAHYQDMVANPYNTLSHAMCYLWQHYDATSYRASILILETAKEQL